MAKGRGDTVEKLFSPKRQYEIPIYQRRYVWGIENWDALWTDIKEKFDNRFNGEQSTSHFTGIIITRKDEKGQGLPKYQILDGQQRLITFQILLCVIRDICKSKNYTLRADSADLLVKNKGYNEKYKLYPKEGFDETAFQDLVNSKPRGNHVMHCAYDHFMNAIIDQIGTDSQNIDHLYNAITNDFHMDQIDLKKRDEPEKIFASLNATGRMLDEFDHLRNDLFLKAGEAGEDLYGTRWSHFDTDSYWEDPGNLDQFLRHFLQATVNPECFQKQEGKDIKAFDVYLKQYRPKLKPDQDIKYEFRRLKRYSKVYQEMDNPKSEIGSRMKFYKEFDIEDMFPFILFIISEFSEFAVSEDEPEIESLLSETDLELIFDVLESYMMRRMLRWGRDYDYKSIDMVNKFHNICLNQKSFSLPKFIVHLANRSSDRRHQDKWSTDTEVDRSLTEEWHVHVEKGIRYILYRIEAKIREEKNIPTIDFTDTLRLERIMPAKWEYSLNWQLPLEEDSDRYIPYDNIFTEEHKKNNKSWRKADPSAEGLVDQSYSYALDLAKKRRKHQKSIGNLTLVDVEIDTDQFTEKKPYFEDFHLEINEVIYESENWDATQIEERAEKLLPYFHKLWPSSTNFIETYLSEKYSVDSKVQGKVVGITNSGVTLHLEKGIEGWIHVSEMGWTHSVKPSGIVSINDEIEAVVMKIINPTDAIRISLSMKPFQLNPWPNLEQNYSIYAETTGTIRDITDEGVFVEIEKGIFGKIDYSEPPWLNKRIVTTSLNEGDEIEVIVLRIDVSNRRVNLGFKSLPQNPWELLERNYSTGSKVTGRVRKIVHYGAFIEIDGGIEGLLHNAELSWRKQNVTAKDFFEVDEEVEVVILKVDASKQHVSLGFKQLQLNPWDEFPKKYKVGSRVHGRIVNIVSYGAFVEIEEGIEGLLHNAELSWRKQNVTAKDFFEVDEEVEVVILKVDASKQHVSLGFKQLQLNPWDEFPKKYKVGSRVHGRIVNIVSYGAFVEIEEGIEGLLRITELSWTKRNVSPKDFFQVGDEVEVVILKIDTSEQHVLLSLKQLQPNPWEQMERKYPIGTKITRRIRKIINSGAFIEIEEGVEGLLGNTELSWTKRNVTAQELFKEDEEVEVVVLKIDTLEQHISLGFKQLQLNPWDEFPKKYKVGSRVHGRIVNIVSYGAFVEIEEGIEGLVHISELTDQEIEKPEEVISVGEEFDMKVIQVSSKDQRIRLSLKAMIDEKLKNQPRWISLIESQTIVFTTREGKKQLSDVEVRVPDIIGLDSEKKESIFSVKQDILFAYSEKASSELLYHIIKRISIQEQKSEQIHVQNVDLKLLQETQTVVTAIVPSGHELQGIIEGSDKDAIYMQINKKTVIVFRHSLCSFKYE